MLNKVKLLFFFVILWFAFEKISYNLIGGNYEKIF